jgi:hypothetical protein
MTEKRVLAKDIVDLTVSTMTEENRERLREVTIKQLERVGKLDIISMLASFKDDPDTFVVQTPDDGVMYAMSFAQLVTFVMGITLAVDAASEVICSDMTPMDILLASMISDSLEQKSENKNEM